MTEVVKPSTGKRKLDKRRPYIAHRDLKNPNHRFVQDGYFFNHLGEESGKSTIRVPEQASKSPARLSQKEKIKAKAAAKLGTLETKATIGAPRVPKTVADAYKENAQAAAAEEGAE